MVADGSLQVLFVQYVDITPNLLANGTCCVPANCATNCGNYFELCYKAINTSGSCLSSLTTGVHLTEPAVGGIGYVRNFSIGDSLGNGLTNPVSLSFFGAWLVSDVPVMRWYITMM